MKNVIKSIVAVAVFAFSFSSNAQTPKNENSVLWEVSGKGLTQPSYLFGTVHMICGKDFVMKSKALEAFSKTSKLALEINMDDAQEMSDMQKAAVGIMPLSKKLTSEESTELNEILEKTAGMKLNQVDNFTMATIMSLIAIKSFGCTNLKSYEMEFVTKAKAANKTIVGLEKVKAQLDFLNNAYTDQEMIAMLKELNIEETKKMVQYYIQEDISNLYLNVTDKKVMNEKTKSFMLDQRNNNWVSFMPEMMQKESVFFAVGAAHLAGELGVINLLKKAGYTVKPIMN
jgi:uncharacterized protein YbaP (TraB family)